MGKQNRYIFSLTFLLLLLGIVSSYATHNRAGEIIYTQIDELTIRATIITYTKTSSIDADRDSLLLFWGDGTSEWVNRSNGQGLPLAGDIKYNFYIAEHTYPGRGTYTMHFTDPNRIGNILNVNAPNSIEIPFYVETTFTLLNSQFQGSNSSVQLLKEPIEFACIGKRFVHNPNAFDVDGDSIAYELVVPQQAPGEVVPNYKYPDQIVQGSFNQISLDPITGDFVWDSPQIVGEYNIAIRILEYRNGVLIGSVTRDMQIFVSDCENDPPVIESIEEICVIAGEFVRIPITINDPNPGDLVSVTATGGPFEQEISPAILEEEDIFLEPEFTIDFTWQTACEHISEQFYQVVIKAVDDFQSFQNTGLADLKTIRIKVVGPPPQNLQTEAITDAIKLTWDSPYSCENAEDDYFQGFSVWRKLKSNQFDLDTCNPGLDGRQYEKIKFITNEKEGDQYVYYDTDILKGNTYCYRVLGEFAKISAEGFPYNPVSSLPSNEACGILTRDIPLITKVSVTETSFFEGAIEVKWVKPKVPDLDTTLYPGPYRYQILRGIGINPTSYEEIPEANYITTFFSEDIDSIFNDTNLNTFENQYTYKIDFYTGSSSLIYGNSSAASSVFAGITPNDNLIDLIWQESVPWENYEYTIYRRRAGAADFDSIAEVNGNSFRDEGLINGEEYCYVIRSIGTYGITEIEDPLYNFSQEVCSSPVDSMPPCPPALEIINLCENPEITGPNGELINQLRWRDSEGNCLEEGGVAFFNIYFSNDSSEFEKIGSVDYDEAFIFNDILQSSLSGCYAITAVDSSLNESEFSTIVCAENCPLYELPNTFTPNNDNHNDLFKPIRNRFVSSVEFKVFNRWGGKVFETTDPEINWDGTNFSGNDLAEGVYYYTCVIKEQILGSDVEVIRDNLTGNIHIIRSN